MTTVTSPKGPSALPPPVAEADDVLHGSPVLVAGHLGRLIDPEAAQIARVYAREGRGRHQGAGDGR